MRLGSARPARAKPPPPRSRAAPLQLGRGPMEAPATAAAAAAAAAAASGLLWSTALPLRPLCGPVDRTGAPAVGGRGPGRAGYEGTWADEGDADGCQGPGIRASASLRLRLGTCARARRCLGAGAHAPARRRVGGGVGPGHGLTRSCGRPGHAAPRPARREGTRDG